MKVFLKSTGWLIIVFVGIIDFLIFYYFGHNELLRSIAIGLLTSIIVSIVFELKSICEKKIKSMEERRSLFWNLRETIIHIIRTCPLIGVPNQDCSLIDYLTYISEAINSFSKKSKKELMEYVIDDPIDYVVYTDSTIYFQNIIQNQGEHFWFIVHTVYKNARMLYEKRNLDIEKKIMLYSEIIFMIKELMIYFPDYMVFGDIKVKESEEEPTFYCDSKLKGKKKKIVEDLIDRIQPTD